MPRTHVSHASEEAFQQVAPGISVRDLGIGDVTGGEFTAQVIRIEPEGAHVEALHQHEEGFSLAYVLKGWLDVEFEEIGVQHLGPGTVIPAFNGPVHRELDCGGELELLLLVTQKRMRDEDRHRIFVQQERDAEYKPGLRDYFVYRDFGLEELTGGRMVAHAIKVLPGKHPHGQWHTHDLGFQFVYVADGWVEFDYEDIGKVRLEKGSAVYQPPKIRHAEVAHSDDVLILEVVTPGEFETKTVDAPAREPAEAK